MGGLGPKQTRGMQPMSTVEVCVSALPCAVSSAWQSLYPHEAEASCHMLLESDKPQSVTRRQPVKPVAKHRDVPPPPCALVTRPHTQAHRHQKIQVGSYIGVACSYCTREECRVTSKKNGTSFQKCHAYVKQVARNQILIQYMNNECADEWLWRKDPRIITDKDEKWCAHGRVCNKMIRTKNCESEKCQGRFCHDPKCAVGQSRAHQ